MNKVEGVNVENGLIVLGVVTLLFVLGVPVPAYANCCPGLCCPSGKVNLAKLIAKDVPFDKVLRIAKENDVFSNDTADSVIYKARPNNSEKKIMVRLFCLKNLKIRE